MYLKYVNGSTSLPPISALTNWMYSNNLGQYVHDRGTTMDNIKDMLNGAQRALIRNKMVTADLGNEHTWGFFGQALPHKTEPHIERVRSGIEGNPQKTPVILGFGRWEDRPGIGHAVVAYGYRKNRSDILGLRVLDGNDNADIRRYIKKDTLARWHLLGSVFDARNR